MNRFFHIPPLLPSLLLVLFSIGLSPQLAAANFEVPQEEYERGPLPPEDAFVFNVINQGNGKYILDWQIPQYYYMYKDKFSFTPSQPVAITTVYASTDQSYEDIYFGDIRVYRETATIDIQVTETLSQPVDMVVSYQGCWDGGVCYPPQKATISLSSFASGGGDSNDLQSNLAVIDNQPQSFSSPAPQSSSIVQQASRIAGSVPLQDAVGEVFPQNNFDNISTQKIPKQPVLDQPVANQNVDFADLITNTEDQNFFLNIINQGNFIWLILIFYLSGIALTFTPCVFPTIPLVSGIITRSSDSITPTKGFLMTLTFVISSALTYSLIGIVVGLLGQNLQVMLQQTWIIVVSSLIFIALAASMFGLFSLQVPMAIQQKLNTVSGKQSHGSFYGLAIMGVLSTLIVGPCLTAPLAGILVYLGGQGNPLQGGLSLFVLGLGMGTPLLLAGTIAGSWLPKAGAWLARVQHFFGFVMLLMAVWMLDRVLNEGIALLLYGIVLIFLGIYLWHVNKPEDRSGTSSFIKGASLVTLLLGVLQVIGYTTGGTDVYQPLKGSFLVSSNATNNKYVEGKSQKITVVSNSQLEQQVKIAQQLGKPIMVKFEAEWCVACKQIERDVFSDATVITELSATYQVTADVTEVNDNAFGLLDQYKIPGPPALLFFDSNGNYRNDLLLLGNITKEKVLANVAKVNS